MSSLEVLPLPFAQVVERVQAGDREGMAALYSFLIQGARPHLTRRMSPQEVSDALHDVFLEVVSAIQRNQLRDAERLMAFARTVARRKAALYVGIVVRARREQVDLSGVYDRSAHPCPERTAISHQQQDIVARHLAHLSPREREILTRFYLYEQSQTQICEEMGLTETQFRLVKWRSKARLERLSRKSVAGKPPMRQLSLVRASA